MKKYRIKTCKAMGKDGTYYKPQERIFLFWFGLKHESMLGYFRGGYCYNTIEKAQDAIQNYHTRIKFKSKIIEKINLDTKIKPK